MRLYDYWKERQFLLTLVVVPILTITTANKPFDSNRYHARSLDITFNVRDLGNRGFSGTLFELNTYDRSGRPTSLVSVGIAPARNTFNDTGAGTLQVVSSLQSQTFEIDEIAKPETDHFGTLASVNGDLFLLQPRSLGPVARYDSELRAWTRTSDEKIAEFYLGKFTPDLSTCGAVSAVSAIILRTRHCAYFAGQLVYKAQAGVPDLLEGSSTASPQFVSDDTLIVEDEGAVSFCTYQTAKQGLHFDSKCQRIHLSNSSKFLYAVAQDPVSRRVVVTTNDGEVIQFSKNHAPTKITPKTKFRQQFYSAIIIRDEVHLFSFPTGTSWRWLPDQSRLEKSEQHFQLSQYEQTAMIEPQSVAAYAGRFWSGVWPFGKLYSTNMDARCCFREFARLFPGPEISPTSLNSSVEDPFGGFASSFYTAPADTDSASLGQRIPSLVIWQGSLVASTARTYSWTSPADIENAASSVDARLNGFYGKIFQISSNDAINYEYSSLSETWSESFTIKINKNYLTLTNRQGKSLSRRLEYDSSRELRWDSLTVARGAFGPLVGAEVTVEVSGSD